MNGLRLILSLLLAAASAGTAANPTGHLPPAASAIRPASCPASAAAEVRPRAIAFLPFDVGDEEGLAFGLPAVIGGKLTFLPQLSVCSAAVAVDDIKGFFPAGLPARWGLTEAVRAGRLLHVGRVVRGSVRREKEQLCVELQVLDVPSGLALREERILVQPSELAGKTGDLALAIAKSYEVNVTWNGGKPQVAPATAAQRIELSPQAKQRLADWGTHSLTLLRALGKAAAELDSSKKVEILTGPLSYDAKCALAYYERGYAYWRSGKNTEALADFNQALVLSPDYLTALVDRGVLFASTGKLEDAAKDFDQALSAKPDGAFAYNNRGVVRARQERADDALADFEKAIAFHPWYADAYNNRGVMRTGRGLLQQAIDDFSKALEIKPDYADALFNRARTYLTQGQAQKGLADADRALEMNPVHPYIRALRAKLLAALGKLEAARQEAQAAMKLGCEPDDELNRILRPSASAPTE